MWQKDFQEQDPYPSEVIDEKSFYSRLQSIPQPTTSQLVAFQVRQRPYYADYFSWLSSYLSWN